MQFQLYEQHRFRLSDLQTNQIIVGSLPCLTEKTPCLPVRAPDLGHQGLEPWTDRL